MRKIFKPVLAMSALALSGLAMMSPATPAAAAMVSQVPAYSHITGIGVQLPVELVANRHRYDRRRHGKRYRNRRSGNRHYYRGHWYASPWWILGTGLAIGAGAAAASGGRCAVKSQACARNWGRGGPDYEGCMRYEGC